MRIYKCNKCGKILEPKYEGDRPEDQNYDIYYLRINRNGSGPDYTLPIRYDGIYYNGFTLELCEPCMGEFLHKYHLAYK